ncbi:radical SAM/SPASM domain-containing protein [Methanothrix sp.]|jgi:radical SAM protein with 4Fe4S-binding SPASM domain|uniref:radical SAM/SPASM domain-containing protein n=1 Tax=Methanothrix sp. TaxID=90426 RepID=UPI001BD3A96A
MSPETRPRYRLRREWDGWELFDRWEGRVSSLGAAEGKPAGTQQHHEGSISALLPEYTEPLIDTNYPKTPDFASAPRRIYWELTRRCNLNCKSCFNRRGDVSLEMPFDTIIKVAGDLYSAGVYEIRCTGGEPTQRSDLFDIIDRLFTMGFYISMGTNGIYSLNILKKVMKAPIDWIILSIDGSTEAANSEIRGPGNFDRAIATLRVLKDKGVRIRINTLIRRSHFRYQDLRRLAEICEDNGVESLNCIPLRPMTNDPVTRKLQLDPAEFREFISGLKRLKREFNIKFVTTLDLEPTAENDRIYLKSKSCAAGREGAVISPAGEIYGCSYSPASDPDAAPETRRRYVAGNLLEEDFLEIWNDSSRWSIYRDLDRYKHQKCKECDYYLDGNCIGNCPIMREDPAAFDPYCYLHLETEYSIGERTDYDHFG